MSSLNKVMIIGRLGRDPEMRYTQAGKPVCSLNVATDEGYTNDRGEKVDKTEWHKVVFWDRQAETCSQYLAKGSLVFIEGRLSTRKYQDQQGQDRYVTEIQGQRETMLFRLSLCRGLHQRDAVGFGLFHPAGFFALPLVCGDDPFDILVDLGLPRGLVQP